MSFQKTRIANKTENTEDYLELIADLLNKNGEARIVDIAEKLDIAQSTANKTIKRLQKQGFVKKEPYRSIFLTLKGQVIASNSKKKHKIVYEFLKNL
ncbi:MarR family transcriptional regulator, partial [Alphaproteobacteria bacterium]|nr:MarR family transcriptional regulator [Alphaproteobacteria bacterium]